MPHSSLRLSRRDWLKLSAAGVIGYSMSGWLENLAARRQSRTQTLVHPACG